MNRLLIVALSLGLIACGAESPRPAVEYVKEQADMNQAKVSFRRCPCAGQDGCS